MNREGLEKSRRPKDSPFFQQKLPAWQPLFTAKKSAITFIVLGLVFLPLGILLYLTANSVHEYILDYTDCEDSAGRRCADIITPEVSCTCDLTLVITSLIPGPVYLYYALENFYQNHRRYARSRSESQLQGKVLSPDSLSTCDPFSIVINAGKTLAILPCGAIANSIFNDTFTLTYRKSDPTSDVTVPMTKKGIAWKSDIDKMYGTLSAEALVNTTKPPSWAQSIMDRSPGAFKTDEELMVWMRVSALPTFRKLHRIILSEGSFREGLPAGSYIFKITYTYPVAGFGGRKSFILGNVSWLGGKNVALGVICLLTGSLHLALGIAFLVVHLKTNRQPARTSPPTIT